jgi:hypothetical protein
MSEAPSTEDLFRGRIRHYAEILNPLFDPTPHMKSGRLFEFVCSLVRAAGMQGADWDPFYESEAVLADLINLAKLELPAEQFLEPNRTRIRLALLSYCHLTEMDLPYALIANLLRNRIGRKYDTEPFLDLIPPPGKNAKRRVRHMRPPSPTTKIGRVKGLAGEAGLPAIGEAFDCFYDGIIRNAVSHSDYILADGELRLTKANRPSRGRGYASPLVEWDELIRLVTDTFAFYNALFALYERCRKSFGDFKNAFLPFDADYKGLLQLVFDEEQRVVGFRAYWPNGSLSEYTRSKKGSTALNLDFDADRSINFMVGEYASKPGSFSPLVEHDGAPFYAEIPGTTLRPYWPTDRRTYKINF